MVSNKLDSVPHDELTKKSLKKLLKKAFVQYTKKAMVAKWGEGKNPDKKKFKDASCGETGLLGAKGFIVAKILADPKEFDFFCGTGRMGDALNGDSALVVCEWTGAAEATFYAIELGLKQIKY